MEAGGGVIERIFRQPGKTEGKREVRSGGEGFWCPE